MVLKYYGTHLIFIFGNWNIFCREQQVFMMVKVKRRFVFGLIGRKRAGGGKGGSRDCLWRTIMCSTEQTDLVYNNL